jgi:hypothetical protein
MKCVFPQREMVIIRYLYDSFSQYSRLALCRQSPIMTAANDFYPTLRRAIALAREAGLADAADALESRAFAAFTTGSEAAGETGLAILAFRAQTGSRLPPEACRACWMLCQVEIGKVWPRLRPGWRGRGVALARDGGAWAEAPGRKLARPCNLIFSHEHLARSALLPEWRIHHPSARRSA